MDQRKEVTICICGGHLTPALAVIEEIRRQNLPWNIVFIGRRHAFEGGGAPAQEERLLSGFGVPFYALTTGRGRWFLKALIGFFQAIHVLLVRRPTAVLSFGGYVALPVVTAAWVVGIPVIIHEQTEDLGRTNSITAYFARRILFARDTGIPFRRALFHAPARPSFTIDADRPILYITGGSTGARSLNALVFPIVSELIKHWTVVHQVGAADMNTVKEQSNRYVFAEYFDVSDVSWIYHHAALVIGRAGANTTAEAVALGVPAIFIPLPWSAGGEQTKNAQRLERAGTAIVLDQKTLTPDTLISRIKTTMESITLMRKRARIVAKTYPRDGAAKVVQVLQGMVLRGKITPYEK